NTDIKADEPSIWCMNTGKAQPGRPALGSWLTYGIRSESQSLPADVLLTDPGGHPVDGVRNWSNGWLPPLFQGTIVRSTEPRILNLEPPPYLKGELQEENLAFLAHLNRDHLARHPGETDLEARIASYELAARMQTAAKEALDRTGESGRLPVTENHGAAEKAGRDHNGQGFSSWLAGGGIKGGMTYGETDEFGHKAVVNPVSPNDYHATLLHLFGLDHTKLVYFHNG